MAVDVKEKGASLLDLFKGAFQEWGEDKASRLGAALAYYAIFSIGPLLVVLISIAGLVFGESAAKGQIVDQISSVVGSSGASMIQTMVSSASNPTTGIIGTIIGAVVLLLGAMGIFGQLKDALNTVWEVTPPKGGGIMSALMGNFMSFLVLILMGVLLVAMLIATAVLASLHSFLDQYLPLGSIFWQIVNYALVFGVMVLFFAVIYKLLPTAQIEWKDVWFGALVTAILFVLGQVLLGIYFNFANVGSAFGAASSLVLILVWIYYSAQIVLFGAEITQVYARRRGSWFQREQAAKAAPVLRGGKLVPARSSPWFR